VLLRNLRVDGALVDIQLDDGLITEIGQDLPGEGIDAGSRWATPGLWDNHVHFSQWALQSQRFDVSSAGSAAEVAAMVGSWLSSGEAAYRNQQHGSRGFDTPAAPTTQPALFVGVGFRDGLWPDMPTAALLDATTGDIPVVLVSADLHSAWLNSAALARFGEGGTGLLREEPAFAVTRAVGELQSEMLDGWAIEAGRVAAARGVVGFADLEMGWNLETWQRRMAAGFDSQRVEFAVYTPHLDRAIALGLRTGQRIAPLLSVGRFKVLTDGSLNTRTAYCADPYPDSDDRGLLEVPFDALVAQLRTAVAAGMEPTIHAIGDAANTLALDAFEAVGAGGWIEHAQLVAASDFGRFAALGVTASVQPEHAMDDRDVADRYWAGRTDRVIALRSLLDAGAAVVFGSDAPVAPLDPWVTIAAAVGRSRDGLPPWHPEQRISAAEAVRASTRSTLAVGQPADLVITDLDPVAATHGQLRTMPVRATVLAGRFTHRDGL
jgi:predicted amidohydrolase YtcJ